MNSVAVSPDGSMIALGSKEGKVKTYHLTNKDGSIVAEKMFELDLGSTIYDVKFHDELYHLFVATKDGLKVVNISTEQVENHVAVKEYLEEKEIKGPSCHTLCFTATKLLTGWSDGKLRVYSLSYWECLCFTINL